LLQNIENEIESGILKEHVIVQSGSTQFRSDKMEIIPFMKSSELDKLYDEANLIITHGGTASIIKGVKKNKKVVAVARLKKYKEHIDDHQIQVIGEFSKAGYIIEWKESEDFKTVLLELEKFIPNAYKSSREELIAFIEDYIDNI
jgi:UDP-N-acetylglucosamine transferase subunit ALG13